MNAKLTAKWFGICLLVSCSLYVFSFYVFFNPNVHDRVVCHFRNRLWLDYDNFSPSVRSFFGNQVRVLLVIDGRTTLDGSSWPYVFWYPMVRLHSNEIADYNDPRRNN